MTCPICGRLGSTVVGAGLKPALPSPRHRASSISIGKFGQVGVSSYQVPRHSLSIALGAGCRSVDFYVVHGPDVQVLELPTRPTWFSLRPPLLSPLQDIEAAVHPNMAQAVASEYGQCIGYVIRASVR